MGRYTLLLVLAAAAPAHAETRLALDVGGETRPREEVAAPRSVIALRHGDLARFAAPRSRWFETTALPEPPKLELLELRDNASRDWAPDRDFELAAMWRGLAIAINHHVLDRNWDEAQVTATFTCDL